MLPPLSVATHQRSIPSHTYPLWEEILSSGNKSVTHCFVVCKHVHWAYWGGSTLREPTQKAYKGEEFEVLYSSICMMVAICKIAWKPLLVFQPFRALLRLRPTQFQDSQFTKTFLFIKIVTNIPKPNYSKALYLLTPFNASKFWWLRAIKLKKKIP